MERVIIDTDPGIDDTFAILLALFSSEVEVEGLTIVEGNGCLEDVTRNALRILAVVRAGCVGVYRGCRLEGKDFSDVRGIHGDDAWGDAYGMVVPDDCEEDESAVDFIIRKIAEHPGEITIAALGPLSNIAAAVEKDPETMRLAKGLVIMGGAVGEGNVTPFAEANFHNAPGAAATVFASGIPNITMICLDATREMLVTSELRERIGRLGGELADVLYRITRKYRDFYRRRSGLDGFTPHDAMVIAYLIRPDLAEVFDCRVEVVTEGEEAGRSLVDRDSPNPNAQACVSAKIDEVISMLFCTLFPWFPRAVEAALDECGYPV
jgi:purine nucleosidase